MTSPDERLTGLRQEIDGLLGRCLLRLQAVELLAKSIVAKHQVASSDANLEKAWAARGSQTQGKTFGMLIGEMMGSFIVTEVQQGVPDGAPAFAFKYQVAVSHADFERIKADFGELVKRRNDLVHHFLQQHDLTTEEGCLAAQERLSADLDRFTRAHEDMKGRVMEMEETRKHLAAQLASPEIRDVLVSGRVAWSFTAIAQALGEAANELAAPDGWTCADAATQWINGRYPDEQPENYDCRSWRQVIHDSGLFELKVHKEDGRRRPWYRPRDAGAKGVERLASTKGKSLTVSVVIPRELPDPSAGDASGNGSD